MWSYWFRANFGEPIGRLEETTIQFGSCGQKRYKIIMPKALGRGKKKNQKAEGVALKVRHGLGLSPTHMRVLYRLCPSLQCDGAHLLRE